MVDEKFFEHYGIPRRSGRYPWGSGKDPYQSGKGPIPKNSKNAGGGSSSETAANKESPKKSIKDMSDAELRTVIDRLRLEDQYKELMRKVNPQKSKKGRAIVSKILEDSAKNIGGQLGVYAMGTSVNKIAKMLFKDLKRDIVNPYKGQKEK